MRLRYNSNSLPFLNECPKYFINSQKNELINFYKIFSNSNPVYLEIGIGKGNFILNNALSNPNINYFGLEKNETILYKAVKSFLNYDLKNLKTTNNDANNLTKLFKPKSIDKIFLNFSDPWPKKRHAKRRLTHPHFLEFYQSILKSDGYVELKTDNDLFFNWTMNEILLANKSKYEIIYCTNDLYSQFNNPINVNNIPSEYETKFVKLNKNINKVVFKFKQ